MINKKILLLCIFMGISVSCGLLFVILSIDTKLNESKIKYYQTYDTTKINAKLIYFYPRFNDTLNISICKDDYLTSHRGTNEIYCIKEYGMNYPIKKYSSNLPMKLIKEIK